jgi:hypothetical protein
MVVKIVLSADCDECCNHRGGQCRLNSNKMFYCHNGMLLDKLLMPSICSFIDCLQKCFELASVAGPKKKRKYLKLLLGLGIGNIYS